MSTSALNRESCQKKSLESNLPVPGSSSTGGDLRGTHPLPVANSIEGFPEEITVHWVASYVPSPYIALHGGMYVISFALLLLDAC